ncbi:MAG: adenylate/guanylate cyclase domain-containing protein, partial [Pseudomonadota bacterium]
MSAETASGAFAASFVPRTVALSAARYENARGSDEPSVDSFEAAVCVVDIAGFTPITERFEQSGPEGVEILSAALASVFEPLIERITGSGGEVATMPGDAIVAYWPGDASGADAAMNAALTALSDALDDLKGATLADGTPMSIHVGLASGPVSLVQLGGGETDRRFFFLTGETVNEAFDLADATDGGQLLVSKATAERLAPVAEFAASNDLMEFRTLTQRAAASAAPADTAELDVGHFLQRSLRARIGAQDQRWLAEYRRLNVLFINIAGASIETDAALRNTHELAKKLETVIQEHGGDTQGIVVDGKKTEVVALFGLPMLAREDDAHRALSAAKRIEREIASAGLECVIGISSGPIFCGQVGTDVWRAYTVHGTTMNRAARIAGLGRPGVTIDGATLSAAGAGVSATALPPTPLRGVDTVIELHALDDVRREARAGRQDQVFGREIEMKRIHQTIDRLAVSKGPAQTMIVQGPPGIGKSMLLRDGALYASQQGLRI